MGLIDIDYCSCLLSENIKMDHEDLEELGIKFSLFGSYSRVFPHICDFPLFTHCGFISFLF